MKKEKDYKQDLNEIRNLMERSSKFLSLSGWSGIVAGVFALAGVYIAYRNLLFETSLGGEITNPAFVLLLAIAVLLSTLATAWGLSYQKARRRNETLWNPVSRRMLAHLLVPLLTGATLIFIFHGAQLDVYAPAFTLIFYGLAMLNAGKFTFDEIRSLGVVEVILGLGAAGFPQYSLVFWALGFGVLHLTYGIVMYMKHEK